MMQAGQVVLFRFPQTDLAEGKLRPALLLGRLPGEYNDWLLCMISSQIQQRVADFDEVIDMRDADYAESGLKAPSVLRIGRLAVVDSEIIVGAVGQVAPGRLAGIRRRLADWLVAA